MSKKINLNNINTTTLSMLSKFHIAYKAICEYSRQRKNYLKKVEAEIEKYKAENKPEREDGSMNPEYSLSQFEQKIGKVNAWYDRVTEPLKEDQKEAMSLVDKDLYYAYIVAMTKGDIASRGTITLTDNKGKVTGTYTATRSYKQQIREFLETMGLDADNQTALEKCAKSLSLRCGGMLKDNKGNYLKVRNLSGFNQILILAFLQYAIVDRRSFIINADNSLAINKGVQEVAA